MSYEFYKVLHLFGLFLTFTGLTIVLISSWMAKAKSVEVPNQIRILGAATHGVGLIFVLVAGFGLAARLNYMQGLPGWIYAKLVLWLIAGGIFAVAKRKSEKGLIIYTVFILTATLGAWLAVNKPF